MLDGQLLAGRRSACSSLHLRQLALRCIGDGRSGVGICASVAGTSNDGVGTRASVAGSSKSRFELGVDLPSELCFGPIGHGKGCTDNAADVRQQCSARGLVQTCSTASFLPVGDLRAAACTFGSWHFVASAMADPALAFVPAWQSQATMALALVPAWQTRASPDLSSALICRASSALARSGTARGCTDNAADVRQQCSARGLVQTCSTASFLPVGDLRAAACTFGSWHFVASAMADPALAFVPAWQSQATMALALVPAWQARASPDLSSALHCRASSALARSGTARGCTDNAADVRQQCSARGLVQTCSTASFLPVGDLRAAACTFGSWHFVASAMADPALAFVPAWQSQATMALALVPAWQTRASPDLSSALICRASSALARSGTAKAARTMQLMCGSSARHEDSCKLARRPASWRSAICVHSRLDDFSSWHFVASAMADPALAFVPAWQSQATMALALVPAWQTRASPDLSSALICRASSALARSGTAKAARTMQLMCGSSARHEDSCKLARRPASWRSAICVHSRLEAMPSAAGTSLHRRWPIRRWHLCQRGSHKQRWRWHSCRRGRLEQVQI